MVQTAITQLYRQWHRVARMDNPDGYARTVLVRSYLGVRADLEFGTADGEVDVRVAASPMQPGHGDPNTTVDGHDTYREKITDQQHSDSLFVYDVSGLQADVLIHGRTAADLARVPDGVLGVYRTLTVHPGQNDWTDRPLR